MTHSIALAAFVSASLAAATWQATGRPPPPDTSALPVWAPLISKHRLSNGLPVWVVEQHELPVVQVSLLVTTGTAADPPGRYGTASLTAAMLTEGAGTRSAVEIADTLDDVLANLLASSSAETSFLRLYVPVAGLAAALPLMADAAQRPTFPAPQLDRLRQQRLGMLRGVRDDPDTLAALVFARGLYGPSDRNAVPQIGNARSLEAITTEDLRAFHQAMYRPDTSRLLVVGDVTGDDVRPLLEAAFGRWQVPGAASQAREPAHAIRPPSRQLLLAEVPGAPQSRILIGGVNTTGQTRDAFSIQVLNAILRNRFGSPRTAALRDYTTGVRTVFDRRTPGWPLAVATSVQAPRTADALAEILREIDGALTSVSADELARAKSAVALEVSRAFEATGRISSRLQALEALVEFNLADDYYATYTQAIQAVSADDVRRMATAYLHADHLVMAIVGDRPTIEPGIRALGLGSLTTVRIDDLFAPIEPLLLQLGRRDVEHGDDGHRRQQRAR